MALPEGFHWQGIHLNDHRERVLALRDVGVVRLDQKVDRSWFAILDYHLEYETRPPNRACMSYESGKHGAELWAIRHEARLRAEIDARIAARPKPRWVSDTK